jgi:hypothetical protein
MHRNQTTTDAPFDDDDDEALEIRKRDLDASAPDLILIAPFAMSLFQ